MDEITHPRPVSSAKPAAPSKLTIWAALITVYIVWGSTYLAIRLAVATMPPFLMAGARFLVAGTVLYAWRRLSGDPAPTRREWRSAAIVGLLLLLGGNGGVVWAEQRVPSGVAALIVGGMPLWMVLLDALRPGGRRPGRLALGGVLIGFVGIMMLVGPNQLAGGSERLYLPGVLALIWASFSWALGSLYSRHAPLPAAPLLGTSMEMLSGGAALFLSGLVTGEAKLLHLGALTTPSVLAWLYLVVFGSWVGFSAYTWLLRVAPTPLVSTYAYVNPVVAVFLGYLIAAEPLTWGTLVATVIIVGAVALTTASQAATAPPKKTDREPIHTQKSTI